MESFMQTHSVHIVEREKNLTGVTQCVSYTNITLLDLKNMFMA